MLAEELVGKLAEIDNDANLPQKAQGELDRSYVDKMWPGLIAGLTNHVIDEKTGNRNYDNVKALTAAGYHAFAMNRGDDKSNPCGRVRTSKGIILIF